MEEIKLSFPILKAVKKTTYNSINNHVNFGINGDKIKNSIIPRSKSSKKIDNFVPNLKPKKSTFMPTPLKLNKDNKVLKEKDELETRQLSEDENELEDESSCSSLSSSDIDNSFNEEDLDEVKNKEVTIEPLLKNNITKNQSKGLDIKKDSFNLNEIKECNELEENVNPEIIKNIKGLRKKMSQIKAKVDILKSKEVQEIVNNNFKNIFDFGVNKDEEVSYSGKLHSSINIDKNKSSNFKPRTKSIFEVISLSKQSIKK